MRQSEQRRPATSKQAAGVHTPLLGRERASALGREGTFALSREAGPRAGLSILEVLVTLSILVVAGSLFCQMLVSGRRIRLVNHEKTLAADAGRVVLERMRNRPFLEVYRAYNEDPADDPGGNGTGPGSTFEVEGLSPRDGGSAVGRIYFPSMLVQLPGSGGGAGKLGSMGGGGTLGGTQYQLREDHVDARLGMPRDLTGDNKIDDQDHSTSYLLLPVCVRIEWKGGAGERRFEIVTQLGDFPLKPEEPAVMEDPPQLDEPILEDPPVGEPGLEDPVLDDPEGPALGGTSLGAGL